MDRLDFRQWLEYMDRLASSPQGAGEIWQSMSNTGEYSKKGVRSPNVAPDGTVEVPKSVDPEELYGKKKKCKKTPMSINKEGL
jgi:hypothetical protein